MPRGHRTQPDAIHAEFNIAVADVAQCPGNPAKIVYAGLAAAVCPPEWTSLAPLLAASASSDWEANAKLIDAAATEPAGFAGLAAFYDAQGIRQSRKRLGQFFTPRPLASHLVRTALGARETAYPPRRILDPACGTGIFLLEAGLALSGPDDAIDAHTAANLYGVDLDPIAVELCRLSIWLAAGAPGQLADRLVDNILVGNPLLGAPSEMTDRLTSDAWSASHLDPHGDAHAVCTTHQVLHLAHAFPLSQTDAPPSFDLIVGNPPFLNELRRESARPRAVAKLLRAKSVGALRGYADTATAFLWEGFTHLADDGLLAMVQPASVLSNRDAEAVRRMLGTHAPPVHLWLGSGNEFDATVNTCGIVIQRAPTRSVRTTRSVGIPPQDGEPVTFTADESSGRGSWGPLAAPLLGIPAIHTTRDRTLVDLASATADFRDEYYGLRGHLVDGAHLTGDRYPPVINTGMIDLAVCRWGDRAVRLLGEQWTAPRLDRDALETPRMRRWAECRLVPKILVATQTRTIEVYVDEAGELLPTTPLISVVPNDADQIWHVAAQLACPQASAFAATETFGAGLSLGAIRLSATQVRAMPMLLRDQAVEDAADTLRSAHHAGDADARHGALRLFGDAALSGTPDRERVLGWWWQNLNRGARRKLAAQP